MKFYLFAVISAEVRNQFAIRLLFWILIDFRFQFIQNPFALRRNSKVLIVLSSH